MEKGTDISLIGCMRKVPDPRAPYNQKHKLLDIIVITITAVLSGMNTWTYRNQPVETRKKLQNGDCEQT